MRFTNLLVLLAPLSVACASSAPPPATAANASQPASQPPAAGSNSPNANGIEGMKAAMAQAFCEPGAALRVCFAIPDDAACSAAFDAAWPGCTQGVVVHDGESEEDRATGEKVGRCIGGAMAKKFPATVTEACKKAVN